MALNWITKSPYPLTKIAITRHGTYRIVRSASLQGAQIWSVSFSARDGSAKPVGAPFTSEEVARGAAFDDAQLMAELLPPAPGKGEGQSLRESEPIAIIADAVAALADALDALAPDSMRSHAYADSLSRIRRAQGELAVWVEAHQWK